MTAARARAAFVGRFEELDRLRAASTRAMAGGSSAVLCFGEAGIGKSRLVAEFTARARAEGIPVLVGGCVELGSTGLPYGPFAEVLRTAVRDGLLAADALHPDTRRQLAMLVPELGARGRRAASPIADGRPELGQVPLFEAVLAALATVSRRCGLIVVLEDLHWADRSTMDLLAFLTRNLESASILLVATIRSDVLDRHDPLAVLVTELTRRPGVDRLDLQPLDLETTIAQLGSVLGYEPGATLARRIHERSDGNPFFVEQLAWAHLDGETEAIPPSLRDLLLSQLSRLPTEVQHLLAAVAVGGPHADERLLAAMLEVSGQEVLARLRVAVNHHVLVAVHDAPRDGYAFHHALVAEAAESDLLDGERRRLHARCADALAAERPRDGTSLARWAGRIAYHRDRAGQRTELIAASIEAALAAEAIAAHADAFVHYLRATDELQVDEPVPYADWDRAELFERAGASAALAAAYAKADEPGVRPPADMAAIALQAPLSVTPVPATHEPEAEPETGAAVVVRAYGLTHREMEILSLLAAGLTNRQIGEQLFISPKTAGVHVSNLLGKLGVNGRVQAATLAHHLGVQAPPHLDATGS